VAPVFGNLRANKRLDRFTPRGRAGEGRSTLEIIPWCNVEMLANAG